MVETSVLKDACELRDEELRAALATDLDGSFELLVLAYQQRLYGFAFGLLCSPQDAEEVAQDALVRAYRALEGYPAERVRSLSLRAWLYQIALNVARNRTRGKRLRLVALGDPRDDEGDGPAWEPEGPGEERPERVYERSERAAELRALLATLPERYREAVVLRHVEGLPYDEMAEALGQPTGTVKSNVHRGVQLLRRAMHSKLSEAS
jgi:RNA polymerase sigma-70 factor (ECF subfamily)